MNLKIPNSEMYQDSFGTEYYKCYCIKDYVIDSYEGMAFKKDTIYFFIKSAYNTNKLYVYYNNDETYLFTLDNKHTRFSDYFMFINQYRNLKIDNVIDG